MATEAMSLRRWLGFYATDRQEQCVAIVLRLLKLAFPAACNNRQGWEAVRMTLESFYETSLTVEIHKLDESRPEMLRNVLELVLAAVVQCEAKETFVKDILSMDNAVQTDLMTVIERVMDEGARGEKEEEEKETNMASGRQSPLYLTRYAALEQQERENKVLKEENIQLAQDLTHTTEQYHAIKVEKEDMVSVVQQLKEQMEADGLRRERSLHAEYDGRIQTLQLQIDSLKAELDDKTVLASKVPALRDEMDLLRPVASKLVKMEAAVVKYKAKIDELAGAKDSLRHLEGINADLIEAKLALESKLAKAASWQRKLKEAKETNTIMESRVLELETQLFHERQELVLVRADVASLQSALQEAKALNAQLQQSADHLLSVNVTENDSSCSTPTVASNISEFNPELMQKLIRLEYENVALKNQVDSETGARIDGLLDKVDDLARLKKSFEQKYFGSQHVLQSTTSEFKSTKAELDLTIARFQANAGQLREWQWCLQEDVAAQVLEKQTTAAERDCLAARLYDGIERQQHLTRALSSRDHELSDVRKANETLACQNERLIERCERLSRSEKALETKLARQNECVAMQAEDANTKELRLRQQKTRELNQMCLQNKEQVADIISTMTVLVEAKSAEIVQLMSKLQKVKLEHDIDQQKLEAAHIFTAKELKLYQQQYSVSNADWNAKEEKLKSRMKELERRCSQCAQQELALKSMIKSQLQSNGQLVVQNKVMKADVVKAQETIAMLENTITRLESKVALLERERSHFFAQKKRKRDTEDGMSSYSCQLSTQITLLVTELEKVLQENKKLHTKPSRCHCCRESPRENPQKANKYYMNRIQHMEHDQQQAEQKRRELLFVNAKLILEQKQLHVKNASLSNEVCELKESLNHWRLCDERRRKKEEQPSLSLENNVMKLPVPCAKRSTEGLPTDTIEQRAKLEHEQETMELSSKSQNSSDNSSVTGFSSPRTHETGTSLISDKTSALNGKRKRQQETNRKVGEMTRSEAGSSANCNFTDAKAFCTKPAVPTSRSTSQRRPSYFITRSLALDEPKQDTEKPSECKQQ